MLNANKNVDRLERDLRQAILAGSLAPSSRLVSVRSLADQYGLTYGRTLRALKRLEKQGMLVSRHGGGTYVADQLAAKASAPAHTENGNSGTILVAPQNYWTGDELWFVEFIRGFESHLAAGGSRIHVIAKEQYLKQPPSADARTHVLLASMDEEQLEAIRERSGDQATFILIAFDPVHAEWAMVMDVDGAAGMRLGLEALEERGHSDVVMLTWAMPPNIQALTWWTEQREAAYSRAMKHSRRKPQIVAVPFPATDSPTAEQRHAMEQQILPLLKKRPRPTALLCVNDLLARFAMELCVRQKIKVPADISIVGFDDDPWAITQSLTTFHRPYRELGQMAGEIALQNQRQTRSRWRGALMIEPQLILRTSAGVARV
jgi:DNA-binding LacI/PurR family transcriptional regulator